MRAPLALAVCAALAACSVCAACAPKAAAPTVEVEVPLALPSVAASAPPTSTVPSAPPSEKARREVANTLGALARAAVAGYEREQYSDMNDPDAVAFHALCKSASAVPAHVPRGVFYTPRAGADFDSGDGKAGWRCLKFSMTEPFPCQLSYRAGSGYKAPKRGGPSPGPNGFEVSAECDWNGDGRTWLAARGGRVREGQVVLDTELFTRGDGG